jgi:hypothetical protein
MVSKPRVRLCRCGRPTIRGRHHYCVVCQAAAYARPRQRSGRKQNTASTTVRGYGAVHQALRKRWASRVVRGEVRCARCGRLIVPGTPWDLGHDDYDRSRYTGPEHRACNRATSGRRVETRVRSRRW